MFEKNRDTDDICKERVQFLKASCYALPVSLFLSPALSRSRLSLSLSFFDVGVKVQRTIAARQLKDAKAKSKEIVACLRNCQRCRIERFARFLAGKAAKDLLT